jgi:hypothetical protein
MAEILLQTVAVMGFAYAVGFRRVDGGAGKVAMVLVDGEVGSIDTGSWAWAGVGN